MSEDTQLEITTENTLDHENTESTEPFPLPAQNVSRFMLRHEGDLGVDEVGQDRVVHGKSIRGLGVVRMWILETHETGNIL
jgi:hypothetical protein